MLRYWWIRSSFEARESFVALALARFRRSMPLLAASYIGGDLKPCVALVAYLGSQVCDLLAALVVEAFEESVLTGLRDSGDPVTRRFLACLGHGSCGVLGVIYAAISKPIAEGVPALDCDDANHAAAEYRAYGGDYVGQFILASLQAGMAASPQRATSRS